MNIFGKRSDLPFSHKSDGKKEKSSVSLTHVQNIICSQTQLDGIALEKTIICRQLFGGHVVGCRPMKRKKNLLRMIIIVICSNQRNLYSGDSLRAKADLKTCFSLRLRAIVSSYVIKLVAQRDSE